MVIDFGRNAQLCCGCVAARVRVSSCKERLAYACVVLFSMLYKCCDVPDYPVASIIMVGDVAVAGSDVAVAGSDVTVAGSDVAVAGSDVAVANLGLDVGCSVVFLWSLWQLSG